MWRRRSLWLASLAVLYVGAASVRLNATSASGWLGLLVALPLLLVGWALLEAPATGVDRIEPAARSAARLVVTGGVLIIVAAMAPDTVEFVAAQRLGMGLASVASLVSLAQVSSLGGIAARPQRARYEPAIASALLWTLATGLSVSQLLRPGHTLSQGVLSDYVAVAASLGHCGVTLVASYRIYAERRFELGVAERVAASLWLTLLALAVGLLAALMGVAEPETSIPAASFAGALMVAVSVIVQEPTVISRLLRISAAIAMLCAPLLSVAVVVAYKMPTHAGLIVFMVTLAAASCGLLAPKVARWLAPERGLWLQLFDEATVVAKQPDPQQAVISVLATIRDTLGADAGEAALYRLASGDRVIVDLAGYLHISPAQLPIQLVDLSSEQPERVLFTEALRSAEIHQPEVRDLLAWLDARGIGLSVPVFDEEVCVGLLAWPAAGRAAPLSHEEILAARRLADHLGAVTGASSQLARSRARELEADGIAASATGEIARLESMLSRHGSRHRAVAERMARPVRVACYSPAAQTALGSVERLGQSQSLLTLVAPAGVDALSWAATAHLASPRADGPLLVVDATSTVEQPLAHWKDEARSPLELAKDGSLVVLNGSALPLDSQRYLGAGAGLEGAVFVLRKSPAALLEEGRLEPRLAKLLGACSLVLPTLAERAEDLRALALHKLSRIGLRLRGEPLGLSLQAQGLVNEHSWPGNDAELDAVLMLAALATKGDVVSLGALQAALVRSLDPDAADC